MVKLALAMIVKDDTEEAELRRCLQSAQNYVHGIFLTGTKQPQERIKQVAKDFGATYSYFEWVDDFAKARNFAFDQVPQEYDFILWLDADDVLHGGGNIQKVLEQANQNNFDMIFAKYFYYVEEGANKCPDCYLHGEITQILIEHLRERLIRNNGNCKWVGSIHETCIPQIPVQQTDNYDFGVVHLTTPERMNEAIYRNIEILQQQVLDENGRDPRTIYYLAKAYFDVNDPYLFDYTIGLLEQYIDTSGWTEEKSQAYQYLAEMYRRTNKYDESIDMCFKAINLSEKFPSLYVDLAMTYLLKNDWSKALHWAKIAAGMDLPKTTLVISPRDLKMRILEVLFNVYWNTGDLEKAEKAAIKLLDLIPDDLNKSRMQNVQQARWDNALVHSIVKLAGHHDRTGDRKRLLNMLAVIPPHLENIPVIADLRNELLPPRTWGKDEIAIYCGPGFEPWGPSSLSHGLGGSESAVIYLTRELTKQGYKVTVFGDPGEDEGTHGEGGTYLPYYLFNINDDFNIFISWRQIGLADLPIKSNFFAVWNHDIQNPAEYTPERIRKVDKVFFLSQWHRENVKALPDSKVFITANGIPDITVDPSPRDPHKMIYASSYDRGLEHLLTMWPQIKKDVPDATLEVMYGWNLFDKMVGQNPERQNWKQKMVKLMEQDGITHHGRVNHHELAYWFATAGIWAYPTHFGEISCITAMMAQTYGAIPVVVNYAALKETVQFGIKVEGDIYDEETQVEYRDALVGLLKDHTRQDSIRQSMAVSFSWEKVAEQWKELFELQEVTND
jgi:glycosyltransferase involved in cell wall biosynthesis